MIAWLREESTAPFEHRGDGGVGVGAAEAELQRAGDFVAEEGWEPGLFVEFDEVEAAHGIFWWVHVTSGASGAGPSLIRDVRRAIEERSFVAALLGMTANGEGWWTALSLGRLAGEVAG